MYMYIFACGPTHIHTAVGQKLSMLATCIYILTYIMQCDKTGYDYMYTYTYIKYIHNAVG
jgi:hypothetical protein